MWTTILIVGGVVVVLFLIVVAMQPPDFRLARSTLISAPPEKIFPLVDDFRNLEYWSPWAKLDPDMQTKFEGPAAGTGSMYSWDGNNKVGRGKMTIIESRPSELVRMKLEFFKPFRATNTAEFTFVPEAGGTSVIWAMTGRNNFMAKAFHLLCNMDKIVGKDFEKGLSMMKATAESRV